MAFTDRFRVKVRIMDEDYVLISPAPPQHLERLAGMVDQKMREMIAKEPRLSVTRAAVLSAMMYADQALSQEDRCRDLERELSQRKEEAARLDTQLARASAGGSRSRRKGKR